MDFAVTMLIAAAGWGIGWLVRDAQGKRTVLELVMLQMEEVAGYQAELQRLHKRLDEVEPVWERFATSAIAEAPSPLIYTPSPTSRLALLTDPQAREKLGSAKPGPPPTRE